MCKKNVLVVSGIILIIGLYLGSKFILFNRYDLSTYNDTFDKLNIEETIDITSNFSNAYLQY